MNTQILGRFRKRTDLDGGTTRTRRRLPREEHIFIGHGPHGYPTPVGRDPRYGMSLASGAFRRVVIVAALVGAFGAVAQAASAQTPTKRMPNVRVAGDTVRVPQVRMPQVRMPQVRMPQVRVAGQGVRVPVKRMAHRAVRVQAVRR